MAMEAGTMETKVNHQSTQEVARSAAPKSKPEEKAPWQTPKLEDVSEQVMAQPYIRFT